MGGVCVLRWSLKAILVCDFLDFEILLDNFISHIPAALTHICIYVYKFDDA